ncbi:related to Glucose-repressible alcohol dehydrogenase transcriptional effector [Saccharomycodes ludwigii]|uniref:CCR4-Not complex 3'-5'-exoribonuclease subunit Ccr4 n=1 Tax=Saccharomycodes ludwigii TaxID=36035 RepID=A0A376B9L8_9ASCO|nr:hypothetical protein SCDLUD_000480 [Saccharomycodes ludwigii]KAH3902885.1 hypothetical protein SCDLUD_000480 [Saccharomycodes ludwigii]SSD61259.1 related to Glucose-repressible alcohol dehydrogenase transcriptional effector [Saccharomycodes ludwigii]
MNSLNQQPQQHLPPPGILHPPPGAIPPQNNTSATNSGGAIINNGLFANQQQQNIVNIGHINTFSGNSNANTSVAGINNVNNITNNSNTQPMFSNSVNMSNNDVHFDGMSRFQTLENTAGAANAKGTIIGAPNGGIENFSLSDKLQYAHNPQYGNPNIVTTNSMSSNSNTVNNNIVGTQQSNTPLVQQYKNNFEQHINDPDYHPHLKNNALAKNVNWELQLLLAAVSRMVMSQEPNTYALKNNFKSNIQQQQQKIFGTTLNTTTTTNPATVNGSNNTIGVASGGGGGVGGGVGVASSSGEPFGTLVYMTKAALIALMSVSKTTTPKTNNDSSASSVNSNSNNNSNSTSNSTTTTASVISTNNNTNGNTTNISMGNGQFTPSSTPGTPTVELVTTPGSSNNINLLLMQQRRIAQFNIDDDDEEQENSEIEKPSNYDDQLWHGLDLCNLKLSKLNDRLFKFSFLTRLFLNGNNLTELPPSIKSLVNLRVLDLSNNRLESVPPELGMLFNLKYLYLFDNRIKNLPYEFGNLFNLQFLGLEGNPLDSDIIKIYSEKNLTGLIFYLRDNAPEVELKQDRKFIEINTDGEPTSNVYNSVNEAIEQLPLKRTSFTLLSYNTLCQHYATPKMYRFTPSWALNWDYRREKLKEQIMSYKTDIICLQEVESKTFDDFWSPLMEREGYSCIFHSKTRARTMQSKDSKKVDGCAIFFKKSEFKLIFKELVDFSSVWMNSPKFSKTADYINRAMNKDNVSLYTKLHHIKSGENIWVATTHLHWDPKFNDVKTFQVGVLLDHLEKLVREQNHITTPGDYKKTPIIICGDFNSQRNSAVYELFNTGSVSNEHEDVKGRDYGHMTKNNFVNDFQFRSCYDCIGELPFTNFSPTFIDVIDYIWYSPKSLRVRGVLGEIDEDYVSKFIAFPNAKFPSDHIPLVGRFEFTGKGTDHAGGSPFSGSNSRKV